MVAQSDTKTLLKILIGTAWIDGEIQPEERKHLNRVVSEAGLAEDADIRSLLHGLADVKPEQCYEWVESYIGAHPTLDDCRRLMESISALIYSDGVVDLEEAKLLNHLQTFNLQGFESKDGSPKALAKTVVHTLRQFYRSLLAE
ncbi:MAG: TerB family tellurite resistance protein [Cyanobacteria bacterium J06635_15]